MDIEHGGLADDLDDKTGEVFTNDNTCLWSSLQERHTFQENDECAPERI